MATTKPAMLDHIAMEPTRGLMEESPVMEGAPMTLTRNAAENTDKVSPPRTSSKMIPVISSGNSASVAQKGSVAAATIPVATRMSVLAWAMSPSARSRASLGSSANPIDRGAR